MLCLLRFSSFDIQGVNVFLFKIYRYALFFKQSHIFKAIQERTNLACLHLPLILKTLYPVSAKNCSNFCLVSSSSGFCLHLKFPSCHLIKVQHYSLPLVLIWITRSPDRPLPDFALMQDLLKGKKLTAIFLTHSHFDHIGALPLISHLYLGTPIYATPATCNLTRVLLLILKVVVFLYIHAFPSNKKRPHPGRLKDCCIILFKSASHNPDGNPVYSRYILCHS